MPARVAMRTAELATAVLSGFGCGTHVITYFLPRRSLVPNHSRSVRAWANSWQGCVMVSMLMTGTLAYLAKPWITRSWRSTDQSSNMGNARTAMASQYVESTRAASLMCSSASPSMIAPSSKAMPQALLPGSSTMAFAPSCHAPSSKEVRVRREGLKKSSAIDLPSSSGCSGVSFSSLACCSI